MAIPAYDRQSPAFYALLAVLLFMSVGPIAQMFVNSFKLDVDIISGATGLLFPQGGPPMEAEIIEEKAQIAFVRDALLAAHGKTVADLPRYGTAAAARAGACGERRRKSLTRRSPR